MAKKVAINQSAEIRSLAEKLGKGAKFKDVFEQLQAQHKGHRFNENSCQQAFSLARKKLGFVKRSKSKRVALRRTKGHRVGSVHAGNGRGNGAVAIENRVLAIVRAARQLIDLTGDSRAAKAVIDHM